VPFPRPPQFKDAVKRVPPGVLKKKLHFELPHRRMNRNEVGFIRHSGAPQWRDEARGVEDDSEVSDDDSESDVESALSTPRAIQADIVSSKAERFMREGHAEAAARECCRGLGKFHDDEKLRRIFNLALRRVATSVPASEECAVRVQMEFASYETVIGEPIELSITVLYYLDPERLPTNGWLALYCEPAYIRRVLHDDTEELSDADIRSSPEVWKLEATARRHRENRKCYLLLCSSAYTYTCTCTYTYVYTCTCLYICIHTCPCMYIHTYIHVFIHTCMHTYVYIHTYIPTYIRIVSYTMW
jgi:hypothetical protein